MSSNKCVKDWEPEKGPPSRLWARDQSGNTNQSSRSVFPGPIIQINLLLNNDYSKNGGWDKEFG